MTIPRKGSGIDIARAVAEAQASALGSLADSRDKVGGAAGVEDSLWATDSALLAYSDLMSAVPDELSSVATALYGMVRKRQREEIWGRDYLD